MISSDCTCTSESFYWHESYCDMLKPLEHELKDDVISEITPVIEPHVAAHPIDIPPPIVDLEEDEPPAEDDPVLTKFYIVDGVFIPE